MGKVYLTFDCEDFINPRPIFALNRILELLQKYKLKAIFFLTGHMCEKLRSFPKILDLLEEHEIGYHSTSHSVHPNIFEYTDIEDYQTAYRISLERETARINPLTGETEGRGGLLLLKDLFQNKKIVSFRAPGFCWSPPHLEALEKLGIRFDFSTNLSRMPIRYGKLTYYPLPIGGYTLGASQSAPESTAFSLFGSLLLFRNAVLIAHARSFVNADWDSIYYNGNPKQLYTAQTYSWKQTKDALRSLELFLKSIGFLAKKGVLEITPPLKQGIIKKHFTKEHVLRSYRRSIEWPEKFFDYTPKFLLRHFFRYFNIN